MCDKENTRLLLLLVCAGLCYSKVGVGMDLFCSYVSVTVSKHD